MIQTCDICFRHCKVEDGKTGACLARKNDGEKLAPANYGMITSIALDPIEKKPLARFYPGSKILSVGSFGCNLKCPFCQNVEISLADGRGIPEAEYVPPKVIASIAKREQANGNIGVAFTYNEPLMGYEYVRDTAKLVHETGMKNAIVSNGCVSLWVLEEILPYIDAMNIDLKCFTDSYYRDVLKGDLEMVKAFITRAAEESHMELTTLIIPGENDSEDEMRALSSWVASLEQKLGKKIPLHITRFFPMSRYADRRPTPVTDIYCLADVAREKLRYVYEGNI